MNKQSTLIFDMHDIDMSNAGIVCQLPLKQQLYVLLAMLDVGINVVFFF